MSSDVKRFVPGPTVGRARTTIDAPTDLATWRRRVLDPMERLGATITTQVHPVAGPDGAVLQADVARLGPPPGEATRVIVLSSGLHGVEGHLGSGLQAYLASSGALGGLSRSTALVMVHAVNPYGLAWSRRVDHQNIDVNRNFIDHTSAPANPGYAEVDPWLNPDGDSMQLDDPAYVELLTRYAQRVGLREAFQTLSGGQYSHPRGVQFGGCAPSWSRRLLESVWATHLVGARDAIALDVHSGLGPPGELTVFLTAPEQDPSAHWARRWFGDRLVRVDDPGLSGGSDRSDGSDTPSQSVDLDGGSVDHGLMGPAFHEAARRLGASPGAFVLEFGTLDVVRGSMVLREDNWLHHHGDPTAPLGHKIRDRMVEQFWVDDPGWRATVTDTGFDALSGPILEAR